MQAAWFMILLFFAIVFFVAYFVIYFFRPNKDDRIISETLAREPANDPEFISRSPRTEPNWPARVLTDAGENQKVSVAYISEGSAFIACGNPLPVGATFQLVIDIPGRQPMEVKAEAIWSNAHLPKSKVLNLGMGIRIIEADADDIHFISQMIKTHSTVSEPGAGTDLDEKVSSA
jgi:hypothetical protein